MRPCSAKHMVDEVRPNKILKAGKESDLKLAGMGINVLGGPAQAVHACGNASASGSEVVTALEERVQTSTGQKCFEWKFK